MKSNIYFYAVFFQGVIRNEGDLDNLGSEFKDAYRAREIDPLDDPTWDSRK